MNIDISIITALIGLLGISLGAFLSGIGYYLKVRSERTKTTNNVLYHLLKIRQLIRSSLIVPNAITDEYIKYCNDYFVRKGMEENIDVPEELKNLIRSHFTNIFSAMTPSLNEIFVHSFNDAVLALSIDDPILAFQINGKERVNEILEAQSNYLESFTNINVLNDAPEFFKAATSRHAENLNYEVINDLIKDINSDINKVAYKSGILTYVKTKHILYKTKKRKVKFNPKELDPVLDKFLSVVIEEANNSNQGAQQNRELAPA